MSCLSLRFSSRRVDWSRQVFILRSSKIFRENQLLYSSSAGDSTFLIDQWKLQMQSVVQHMEDEISSSPLNDLSVTLGRDDPLYKRGDRVPPSWHLLYFHSLIHESNLAGDGYEKEFSPPSPFNHRMWAGSSLNFSPSQPSSSTSFSTYDTAQSVKASNPLRVGDCVRQKTTVDKVLLKKGNRGETVFVTILKEISNQYGLSLIETRTLAYMKQKPDLSVQRNAETFETADRSTKLRYFWRRIEPTPVLLFRYSALTFNAHRIHYDHRYATEVEGYPGLLVHGPLTSCLLLDLLRRELPQETVSSFSYRALSPLFVNQPFTIHGLLSLDGKSCELWATDTSGKAAMTGVAKLL